MIEVEVLNVLNRGDKCVSLTLEKGQIVGLLGPNGSGKSSLLKAIAGLKFPVEGSVFIEGEVPSERTQKIVSYLSELSTFPKKDTVEDVLDFFKTFYSDFDESLFRHYVEVHRLEGFLKTKVGKLSKGTLQKFRVFFALSRSAKIFLLDEPFSGVDPHSRAAMIDVILDKASEEVLIVLASHMVLEIESIISHVSIVNEGEVLGFYECERLREDMRLSVSEKYKEVFENV